MFRRVSSVFSTRPRFYLGLARRDDIRFYCGGSSSPQPKRPGPLTQYKGLVEQGKLKYDPYQEKVAAELENVLGRLEQYEKDMEEYHVKLAEWEERRENERRKLLTEEAQSQQQGDGWSNVKKGRSRFMEAWKSRKLSEKVEVEPGVGKWVSYLNRERKLDAAVGRRPVAPQAPKGLYLYGNVGSGKTMLMDMFFSATEGIVKHRRRFHFHEAMLQINEQMHKLWKEQVEEKPSQTGLASWISSLPFDSNVKEWLAAEDRYQKEVQMKNILPAVADKFLIDREAGERGASVLCFDEIQTVDVFAIVALSGILSRLLSSGTVLVATSNRAPRDLNQDGMQKEIFEKLLKKLDEHCNNILIGSEIDYRRLIPQRSVEQVQYFCPLDSRQCEEFEKMWTEVTQQYGGRITSETISVMFGRTLEVPQSCSGVGRFTFEYLCGRPVGAADYIAVANNYHTVFISDIPAMSMRIRDKVILLSPIYSDDINRWASSMFEIKLVVRVNLNYTGLEFDLTWSSQEPVSSFFCCKHNYTID
uniref:AFG1-like ATPase n=1 Tax=Kalanchoe fedtschenkoi TaxID=63787 RepID=A0A7N0U7T1_KALFE